MNEMKEVPLAPLKCEMLPIRNEVVRGLNGLPYIHQVFPVFSFLVLLFLCFFFLVVCYHCFRPHKSG